MVASPGLGGGRAGGVMPFYLICDVSPSMAHEIPALHAGVVELRDAIIESPVLDGVSRLCIITFSRDAQIVVALRQMSELDSVPKFEIDQQYVVAEETRYGAAFRTLAIAIARDYASLKRKRLTVYRPCVYFLTDGEPTDNWQQAFTDMLNDRGMASLGAHPIIVPFGFRDATKRTMERLTYPPKLSRWYHSGNSTVGTALDELLNVIKQSVILSGNSVHTLAPRAIFPGTGYGSGVESGEA